MVLWAVSCASGCWQGGMGWIYCLRGNLKSIFLPFDSSLPENRDFTLVVEDHLY